MKLLYVKGINRLSTGVTAMIMAFFILLSFNPAVIASQTDNELSSLKQMTANEILEKYSTTQDRMEKIVCKLQHETPEESLKRLHEYALFNWPVGILCQKETLTGVIPSPPSYDTEAVKLILNNRRYVKLMQDISALPKKDIADSINKELSSAMKTYKKLYDSYFQESRKGKKLGFAMSHKDKSPTLLGTKFKVLSLVMLAGHYELSEIKPQLQSVLDLALEQRDAIYKEISSSSQASIILNEASLYNRIILGTSILQTFVRPEKVEMILTESALKFHETKLLAYDYIPSKPYSFSDLFLVDKKNGNLDFRYLEPIDDIKFDSLFSRIMEFAEQEN